MELSVSAALVVEFETVQKVLATRAQTRRVDALILCWVKYEKQLRRLFCFLVFQHPRLTEAKVESVVQDLVNRKNLYPETFLNGIKALGVRPLQDAMSSHYAELHPEISRIKKYRNKIMHGQISGQKITSRQLERDIRILVRWVESVAECAKAEYGYDGLGRNTYQVARASLCSRVEKYPFGSASEFKRWLDTI